MLSASIPENETERLAKLAEYEILDSADEQDYDDIARLVTEICGTSLSTISFVDRERQWFKAGVGITAKETHRDVAFCAHTILGDDLFVVEDAFKDPRFEDNPLVTIDPRLRFYAGMPLITPDGYRLGALCAIDRIPRVLTEQQKDAMGILARHVVHLLELRKSNRLLEAQNRTLAESSELKSRLLSIVSHDLRSPLASMASTVTLLTDHDLGSDEQSQVLSELGKLLLSTEHLIDNVISWASQEVNRAGFTVQEIDLVGFCGGLSDALSWDFRRKGNQFSIHCPEGAIAITDPNVLGFVLRNLLGNANKFTQSGTIDLECHVEAEAVRFVVRDSGVGMSPARVKSLFDWSARSRTNGTDGERGAGLALVFCADFAAKLGGTITAKSEKGQGSEFTMVLPTAKTAP
ncbi:MAG: sensor histidine kinase [Spirochaetaceae bacterium]|nr:MAG: sensor histidine kinase [Spirochaetaceae bacterium]